MLNVSKSSVGIRPLNGRLNIVVLALLLVLWCYLCRTYMIFNRVEPHLKRRPNTDLRLKICNLFFSGSDFQQISRSFGKFRFEKNMLKTFNFICLTYADSYGDASSVISLPSRQFYSLAKFQLHISSSFVIKKLKSLKSNRRRVSTDKHLLLFKEKKNTGLYHASSLDFIPCNSQGIIP